MKKEDNSRDAEKVSSIGIVWSITNEYNGDELIENVLLLTHHTFTTSIDALDIIEKTVAIMDCTYYYKFQQTMLYNITGIYSSSNSAVNFVRNSIEPRRNGKPTQMKQVSTEMSFSFDIVSLLTSDDDERYASEVDLKQRNTDNKEIDNNNTNNSNSKANTYKRTSTVISITETPPRAACQSSVPDTPNDIENENDNGADDENGNANENGAKLRESFSLSSVAIQLTFDKSHSIHADSRQSVLKRAQSQRHSNTRHSGHALSLSNGNSSNNNNNNTGNGSVSAGNSLRGVYSRGRCLSYDVKDRLDEQHGSSERAELSDDAQDFDFSNCAAYPRDYFDSNNADVFASSTHYTSISDTTVISCKTAISDPITDGYNDEYPYAEWTPGSTYRLVWPAKNHAIGEECGETSSTDRGIGVYANMQVNPTSDLTDLSQFETVYDWHEESGETFTNNKAIKGVPFANCMDYCSDTDASPCWGDITIPDDMFSESGFYTFIWYWNFGSNYVSCFDVYIDVNGETQTPPPEGTSSGGSASVDEIVEYHFVAPICYDGADYNQDTVIDTLEDLFSGVGAEFDVVEVDEYDTLSLRICIVCFFHSLFIRSIYFCFVLFCFVSCFLFLFLFCFLCFVLFCWDNNLLLVENLMLLLKHTQHQLIQE